MAGRPNAGIRARWLAAALALTAAAGPAVAADPAAPSDLPSPAQAGRMSGLWTAIPFGAGIAVALLAADDGEAYGLALAATGLEVGPAAGYFYGGIGARSVLGMVGRFALVSGAGAIAAHMDDTPENTAERFGIAAAGFLGGQIWAGHDIKAVVPLVEEANRQRTTVEFAPHLFLDGSPGAVLRVKF